MKRILLLGAALTLALSFSAFAKPSGTITSAQIADISTLNPIVSEDANESEMFCAIFDNLLRQDNKANLLPALAVEVPTKANGGVSKNDLTFTFKLRQGVKWHDGKGFTAKDVKFTFDAYMNDKVPVPSRDPFDKITKFDVVDDYTIRMTLKEIVPAFLLSWAGGGIVPAHAFAGLTGDKLGEALGKGGAFSRNPIGTGPFKFKEWKSGSYVIVEANEDYWGGAPGLEKVVWKQLPDSNTIITQLKTGEVDIAPVQPVGYKQLKDLPNLKVTINPRAIYLHMTFNLRRPMMADRSVRQALAYGLPRQLIVDSVLEGIGSVSGASISPLNWAYDEGIEKTYPFDQKKAKSLLDKAGWKVGKDGIRAKDGTKLSFSIMTNAGNKTRESIVQIAQQYWKEIGVELKPNVIEWNTMLDKMDALDFDVIMSAWSTGSDPDQYSLFHSTQTPTKDNGMEGQNYASYANKDIDELIKLSRSTTDRVVRAKYFKKLQQILSKDLPLLYIYNYQQVNVRPANLENFKPTPFTNTNFWNVDEWKYAAKK